MLRVFVLATLAALSVPVVAQDDAVVPAHEEPRHVPKLVNERVRVVDVEIPEGEQTLYHRHSLDYPYVLVTSVTLYNQVHGQAPKDAVMERGFVGYYDAATKGAYTHRFINRGPGVFRAIGIELMQPPAGKPGAKLPAIPGTETVLDNDRVGAYRIRLAPGQTLGPLTIPGPSIRVSVGAGRLAQKASGGEERAIELEPARFEFREAPATFLLANTGAEPVELVEFVLK
jgi:hypothetical protein